jgi:hypothetical protein
MERLVQTDWSPLFRLEMSVPEILIRGSWFTSRCVCFSGLF